MTCEYSEFLAMSLGVEPFDNNSFSVLLFYKVGVSSLVVFLKFRTLFTLEHFALKSLPICLLG